MALLQSVESSNRIEGVTVAPDRLRPLVLGHARPKDRSEQEIAGYGNALNQEGKEDYYHVLQQSSQRWHDGKHDFLPWLNHFLAIARRAYGEFEQRAGQVKAPRGAKTDLVKAAIEAQSGPFRISAIQHACPGVSLDTIRQVLKNLCGSKVKCLGRG